MDFIFRAILGLQKSWAYNIVILNPPTPQLIYTLTQFLSY